MNRSQVSTMPLPEFSLWEKVKAQRCLVSFDLEITARCNNNCRHCYIALPAGDRTAGEQEITTKEIDVIADEAVSLGALSCVLTGGEPLLRPDFEEIYLGLKKKGLLVAVFTNATLVRRSHVRLFKEYPPRDVEVTVYGVTRKTYESVTRNPGSFDAFMRGLNLLHDGGVKVRLKAMALRSNIHEWEQIVHFCRARTKDFFHFDPFLHLRFDGDPVRNELIKSERLTPDEIADIERNDSERFRALEKMCSKAFSARVDTSARSMLLFRCGAGLTHCAIGWDGYFRLCSSLYHPDCMCDLRKTGLSYAWRKLVPIVRRMRSERRGVLLTCARCHVAHLCMYCPANAYLETGHMDGRVEYFCQVAHARAKMLTR